MLDKPIRVLVVYLMDVNRKIEFALSQFQMIFHKSNLSDVGATKLVMNVTVIKSGSRRSIVL